MFSAKTEIRTLVPQSSASHFLHFTIISMSFAMKCFSIPLVLLIQCAVSVCSENILIIDGFPSPSHQMWTHRLSKAIANHGYNVTLLSPKIINCESLNLHFYHLDTLNGFPKSRLSMGSKTGTWNQFKMYTEYLHYYDVQSVKAKGFLEISNFPVDFLFNVIIYDNLGAKPLLALADRFPDAKLMVASPNPGIDFTNFITKGPRFFSFVPFIQMCDLDGSFVSRSKNFLIYSIGHFLTRYLWLPRSEEIRHSIYPIRRSLEDIYAETNILLVNYDPIFDSAIPILPGVVPVGGLQIEEPIPLSKDLETIFKIPSKGIVYFSIGSNLKSEMLGLKRLRIILDVLGQIPDYTFLWKFEMSNGDLESPKNVFIRNWFPQNDILADNRTKLFISQAGALSMQECTWYGIPMLALPIMFDQFPVSFQLNH